MQSAFFVAIALLLALAVTTAIGQWHSEREYPPIGEFIEVDGVRLHYVVAGSGPGLVLVHGASSNLRDFTASILPQLARHYRVIAFDRPGYGYSERAGGEWQTPAATARLLLDAAARLGVQKPLLAGHSWAGSVVMAAMVEMPERVAGGVLIAGVAGHWAGPVGAAYSLGGVPVLGPLFAWTLLYPAGQLLLEDSVASVLAPNTVPADYVRRIAAPLALRPRNFLDNVEDMNRLSEYMQTLSTRYDEVGLPLLLIHGESDTLVPFWNHGRRLLPVIPQTELVLLPQTGHAPHHAHPAAVVRAIDSFYRSVTELAAEAG